MSAQRLPIECQIFLTRKCNISCEYCVVPLKYTRGTELNFEQWKEVVGQLIAWGIQHIKLLGGEPTQSPHILPLLQFLRDETKLEYLVISNSVFNERMMRKLVDAGLSRYVTSVDDIYPAIADDITKKSNRGLNALLTLQMWGLTELAGNVVISAANVDRVHETIEFLASRGLGVNLCPVIVGQGERFWEYRTNLGAHMRLAVVPRARVEAMVKRLLDLKGRYPDQVLATEAYLRGLASYGVDLNWKCWHVTDAPPQLRIDSDGTLMLCPDIRGELGLHVLTMSNEDYRSYLDAGWKREVERYQCPGCYWSSMVLAAERGIAY